MKLNGVDFKMAMLYRPTFDSSVTIMFSVVCEYIVLRTKWFVHAFLLVFNFYSQYE